MLSGCALQGRITAVARVQFRALEFVRFTSIRFVRSVLRPQIRALPRFFNSDSCSQVRALIWSSQIVCFTIVLSRSSTQVCGISFVLYVFEFMALMSLRTG